MILENFLFYVGCGMMYFTTLFLYWYFYDYEKPYKCNCTKTAWDGVCDESEIDSEFWNQYRLEVLSPIAEKKIEIEKQENIIEVKKIVRSIDDNIYYNSGLDSLDTISVTHPSNRI